MTASPIPAYWDDLSSSVLPFTASVIALTAAYQGLVLGAVLGLWTYRSHIQSVIDGVLGTAISLFKKTP